MILNTCWSNPNEEGSRTVPETEEEIQQALLAGPQGSPPVSQPPLAFEPGPHPAAASQQPAAQRPVVARPASPFRPTGRPPLALLTVFDDGCTTGEIIRLREPRFVLGRTEGDLRIPLDSRISARHVEITYQHVGGLHRWAVTDLQSTHGLFVRVGRTALADRAEFLVGNGRYRFNAARTGHGLRSDPLTAEPVSGPTRGWAEGTSLSRPATLTELLGSESGSRRLLFKSEYWIGSDPDCLICRPDDPFCEPRHVRLYLKPQGGWHAEHNKTPNGLWLRISGITVDSSAQFQIGEQRFQLKIP